MSHAIHVRDIDDKLIRRLKVRAAERGETIREAIIEAVERYCKAGGQVANDQKEEAKPELPKAAETLSKPTIPSTWCVNHRKWKSQCGCK